MKRKQMNQNNQINQTNQSSDNHNVMANPYAVIARSVATKQALTINASSDTDCFAALAMMAKGNAMTAKGNAMMARGNAMIVYRFPSSVSYLQFCSFCNSVNSDPLLPFTFYPIIKRRKPKIRSQRVGMKLKLHKI
jgi:hypothetical protein